MFTVTDEVSRRLEEVAGLNEEQILALAQEALDDDLGNWPVEKFQALRGFGKPSAFAAWTIVQALKVPESLEPMLQVELPEAAPYLSESTPYNPRDERQFYSVPETGEMYRWDGKRNALYPNGLRRRVIQMPHIVGPGGVQIPDPEQIEAKLEEARRLEADWYHRGYSSWVNFSGKPYSSVDPAVRQAVVRAIEQTRENGYVLQTA